MRLIKELSGVLIIFSISTSLSACSANAINNSFSIKEIKIGVTLYKQDDTFISIIAKNIETIAKEKESEGKFKITTNIVDAKGSLGNQSKRKA